MVISEADNIKGMLKSEASFVLIDLRPEKAASKGHIPTAVSVPAEKLAKAKDMFPADKKAPIILYTDSGVDVDSFLMVKSWGYKDISVLAGGMSAWDGMVEKGKPASKIEYVKRTPKGQISIDEFKKVADSTPAGMMILDVREKATADGGMIKGAVNIPYADLMAGLEKLPKDKEIIIHCNTGIQAADAQDELRQKGYNARFLDAVIQVAPDGSYEISEK